MDTTSYIGERRPKLEHETVGQDELAAAVLGSFRQHAQTSPRTPSSLSPASAGLPTFADPQQGGDAQPSRSPRFSLEGSWRPGSGNRSASRSVDGAPPTAAGHMALLTCTRPVRTWSGESPLSTELKPSSSDPAAGSQGEEESPSPVWAPARPASMAWQYPCAPGAASNPTTAGSRRKQHFSSEAQDSPAAVAEGNLRHNSRKRRHGAFSISQEVAGSLEGGPGLRKRVSSSNDSGERGHELARACKSGSDSLPASGPSRLRSSRLNQGSSILHPILQLGWQPLCEVHCNGLTGLFLGGHDRDLYIQATSRDFINLPPVDFSQGGNILSCSQFEKCAGRELSKKWKESIHVLGEGEGSKATLIAWLKRRAAQDFGQGVVGKTVWVCWCADVQYYRGVITHYNADTGKHQVRYSDRCVEDLHLPVEVLSFAVEQPQLSPSVAPPPRRLLPAANLTMGEEHLQAHPQDLSETIPASPTRSTPLLGELKALQTAGLLHQGSGVSVNSDYKLSAADIEELNRGEDALPSLAELHAMQPVEAPQAQESPLSGQPGLIRSLQATQAANDSYFSDDSASQALGEGPPVAPKKPRTGGHGKIPAGGLTVSWLQSLLSDAGLSVSLPAPPSDEPAPSPAAMARWLHWVALHLDDVLSLPQLTQPCQLADLEEKPLSAAACFSALLAQAKHPDCAQGYYEAMTARYHHFADNASLQRAKLMEFVLAALHQDRQRHSASAAGALVSAAAASLEHQSASLSGKVAA